MEILNDFSTSVRKALEEIDSNYESYDALVICGTHSPHDTEEMIEAIREARETGRPFYGECFGHQLACIEWARNVMEIQDATSEEFGDGAFVVQRRSQLKVGLHEGESWWSNYEVENDIEDDFINNSPDNFFTAPFHPSYQSSKDKPHLLLVNFLLLCKR